MSLPSWFDAQRSNNNKRSQRQEKGWAKKIGGKTQVGSGSSWRAPQDVRNDEYMMQIKFTDSDAFRLSVKEWKRVAADAIRAGKDPAMAITFAQYGITLIVTEEHEAPSST